MQTKTFKDRLIAAERCIERNTSEASDCEHHGETFMARLYRRRAASAARRARLLRPLVQA